MSRTYYLVRGGTGAVVGATVHPKPGTEETFHNTLARAQESGSCGGPYKFVDASEIYGAGFIPPIGWALDEATRESIRQAILARGGDA